MRADSAILPELSARAESRGPGASAGKGWGGGGSNRPWEKHPGPIRSRSPQLLLAEVERTVVLQYLRALMQGRLVCRGADERTQAAERLQHDAAQLQELFLGLVRIRWASGWAGVLVIR